MRAQRGLATATWTDPTITPSVTPAKTAHLTELRTALATVYTAAGASPPGYTDPTLSAGTTPIRTVHVGELRAAATAVPLPAPTIQTFYYHTDQIGSVRAITNAAAQTVARYDFDPFGTELQPAAIFRDPRLFAGGERDPETTLDYFGARYYGAHIARFLNPDDPVFGDPFAPQSTNQYAYAYNNPLRFIDPTGHQGDCAGQYNGQTNTCEPWDLGLNQFLDWIGWFNRPPMQSSGQTLQATGLPTNLALGTPRRFWEPFRQGFATAKQALQNPNCSALYAGQGGATMDASLYRFLDLKDSSVGAATLPDRKNARATSARCLPDVIINSTGPFLADAPSNAFGRFWSQGSFRGLILLHELGHQLAGTTGFQADAGPSLAALNRAQSQRVVSACF